MLSFTRLYNQVWQVHLQEKIKFNETARQQAMDNIISNSQEWISTITTEHQKWNAMKYIDTGVRRTTWLAKIEGDYPLAIFSECNSVTCAMTRNKSLVRQFQEATLQSIFVHVNATSACSVGCGSLLPDLVLLTQYFARVRPKTFTLYLIDTWWKKYFTGENFIGENECCKEKTNSLLSILLATFLSWFECMGVDIKLIVCEHDGAFTNYITRRGISHIPPQVTYAIDIRGEHAMASFYMCAMAIPNCISFTVNDGNRFERPAFHIDAFQTGDTSMQPRYDAIEAQGDLTQIMKELRQIRIDTCKNLFSGDGTQVGPVGLGCKCLEILAWYTLDLPYVKLGLLGSAGLLLILGARIIVRTRV